MAESVNPKAQGASQAEQDDPNKDMSVKARFFRYDSPFLQWMVPLLMTRYAHLALEDINPFNFLRKPNPDLPKPKFDPNKKNGFWRYASFNFSALSMGAIWTTAVAFYSKRTYDDIKTLYSEAVGYELGKNKEDVTWHDLLKSENAALAVTREAYLKRTASRLAAVGSFFVPWHKLRDWKNAEPKYDANANAGVGIVGTHLGIYEGLLRRASFFDVEQNLLGTAINHSNPTELKVIQPQDILSLLLLQRSHLNKAYKPPKFNSPEAQNEEILVNRIADLMNQTYNNKPDTERAHFTIGKFNYLVGFGLLDSFPASLGFVELANKSADMKEVNAAAAAIKSGQDPKAVFQKFGNATPSLNGKLANNEPPASKFADNAPARRAMPIEPRTLQDFAMDKSGAQLLYTP